LRLTLTGNETSLVEQLIHFPQNGAKFCWIQFTHRRFAEFSPAIFHFFSFPKSGRWALAVIGFAERIFPTPARGVNTVFALSKGDL
jgi:hypothetical protein